MFPFYFITDPVFTAPTRAVIIAGGRCPLESVVQAIEGGARLIQYRDKINTRSTMYENAKHLREITAQAGATLIINDQIDLALAVSADGVHLGQNDLPIHAARKMLGRKAVVGISTHTLEQAVAAELEGADYIGFGPLFKTTTKNDANAPTGISPIVEISQRVKIPLVAIGGIEQAHLPEIFSAGATSVVAISAISGNIESNVRAWIKIIQSILGSA